MIVGNNRDSLRHVAYSYFVPSLFLGVAYLATAQAIVPQNIFQHMDDSRFDLHDMLVAGVTGLMVGLTFLCTTLLHNRRHASHPHRIVSKSRMFNMLIVGFSGGFLDVLLGRHTEGIFMLTVLVLAILAKDLGLFAKKIERMLLPDAIATWGEVRQLLRIYLNMLVGFTLVNAAVDGAHLMAHVKPPFDFAADGQIFLNAIYFTVVTMTTLGYGDITPHTWDGKVLIIFQCLASYVMFALMIGIVTRGVVRSHAHKK